MNRQAEFIHRVSSLRAALRAVRPKTEQQWLDELGRQGDPERTLELWEIVACAYTAFFEARTPTAKARDQSLRVLLDCAAGRGETEIHKAAYKGLSIAEIRGLIEHYHAAAQTVHVIAHLKGAW